MITYDRKIFFDMVRESTFPGGMNQGQVDGMEYILQTWEKYYPSGDTRWLGYALATARHETAAEMQPIEEYGGANTSYGQVDPTTGQRYYGRGFVQVTHRENYAKTDERFKLTGERSTEWHAEMMLDPLISAGAMFKGMEEGWFRKPNTFALYFNTDTDDPYYAREIINGDKHYVPDWSTQTIGNIIAAYYMDFTAALNVAKIIGIPPGAIIARGEDEW